VVLEDVSFDKLNLWVFHFFKQSFRAQESLDVDPHDFQGFVDHFLFYFESTP